MYPPAKFSSLSSRVLKPQKNNDTVLIYKLLKAAFPNVQSAIIQYSHTSMAWYHLQTPFRNDRRYTSIINYFQKLKDFDRPLFGNISLEILHIANILQRHGLQSFSGWKNLRFLFLNLGWIYQSASKTTITHFPAGTRSFVLWILWNIVLCYQKQISKVIHSTFRLPRPANLFHNLWLLAQWQRREENSGKKGERK